MKFRLKEQFLVALVICSLVGCSSEPSRYAATGTVSMDGKPAPFVVITFHATSGDAAASGSGRTDVKGDFKIGEDGKNSGFQTGEYKVTFAQSIVKGQPTLAGSGGKEGEKIASEKEGVADEFRDREKTPVTANIVKGKNEFKFEIKAKN